MEICRKAIVLYYRPNSGNSPEWNETERLASLNALQAPLGNVVARFRPRSLNDRTIGRGRVSSRPDRARSVPVTSQLGLNLHCHPHATFSAKHGPILAVQSDGRTESTSWRVLILIDSTGNGLHVLLAA